jgi:hypothetical protein
MLVWDSSNERGHYLWLFKSMKNGSLASKEMKMGTHVDALGHAFQEDYEVSFNVDTLDLNILNSILL